MKMSFLKKCDPCFSLRESKKPALNFCPECSENLCQRCSEYHKTNKALTRHDLVQIDESDTGDLTTPMTCSKHGSKRFKYFCVKHERPACSRCVILDHKQCSAVVDLAAHANSASFSMKLYGTLSQIGKIETVTNQLLEFGKSVLNENKAEKASFEQACANTVSKILETIEKKKEEARTLVSECQTKTNQLMDKVKDLEEEVHKHNSFLERKDIEAEYKVIVLGEIKERLLHFESQLLKYIKCADRSLKVSLKQTGNFRDFEEDYIELKKSIPSGDSFSVSHILLGLRLQSILTKDGTKNMCLRNCILTGNIVVATDDLNKTITVFDTGAMEVYIAETKSEPFGIAWVSDTEFVVSFPEHQYLNEYRLQRSDAPKFVKKIDTSAMLHGLASFTKDGKKSIIGLSKSGFLLVLERQGKETNKVDISQHIPRAWDSWKYISHIAVDPQTGCVYISVSKSNTVIGVNFDGECLFRFTNKVLMTPLGLAVSSRGTIYICSYGTHKVLVVERHGDFKCTVLGPNDGLAGPMAVAVDEEGGKIVICEDDKCKEIKMFQN